MKRVDDKVEHRMGFRLQTRLYETIASIDLDESDRKDIKLIYDDPNIIRSKFMLYIKEIVNE